MHCLYVNEGGTLTDRVPRGNGWHLQHRTRSGMFIYKSTISKFVCMRQKNPQSLRQPQRDKCVTYYRNPRERESQGGNWPERTDLTLLGPSHLPTSHRLNSSQKPEGIQVLFCRMKKSPSQGRKEGRERRRWAENGFLGVKVRYTYLEILF